MDKSPTTYANIIFWIISWFMLNLAITLLNKAVFSFGEFNYPAILTVVHMISSWIVGYACIYIFRLCDAKELDHDGWWAMFKVSLLFTGNIILGNVSLRYVSVSFNQIMRATVPAVTMLLSGHLLKESFSADRKYSMVVVIFGVMVACYGDIEFTYFGFGITLVAIIAAAVKAVVSSMILGGSYNLHPIDFLYRMSSFATFESFIWSFPAGEVESLWSKWNDYELPIIGLVLLTGAIAFFFEHCFFLCQ